ncbi:uncharacterized protein LOC131673984 [Phymastichus coffea]|uniref:uncharacterized protein LOC131673984 n=1 Tax=Phymastichus coffea TaxID=108790 RepID=UPI00273A7600|nr:uncharacterized protein LOC131673984 [Phymastichus coffea]XP_058808379.1 uncharacterized protein LOC131673984 [Phymastichus coffea]
MSYVGNMPADWQQYSALQSGETDRQQQQQQQQQISPSTSSSSTGSNLYNLDCLSKQQTQSQNDGYYTTASSTRLHHHVGSYAMEATVGDDLQQQQQQQQQQQRQVQMPMSSPSTVGRIPSTTMTVNSAMGSVSQMIPGPIQPPPVASSATSSRQSSYACKGPCCQAVAYRWDKMSPFATNNAYAPAATASPYTSRYRPDLYTQHPSAVAPPSIPPQQSPAQRRFRSSKESSHAIPPPRAYQQPPNYSGMQPYNYPPTDYHHQKYYARAIPTQPQNHAMINPGIPTNMQDKYLASKQSHYQAAIQNGTIMPNPAAMPPANLPSPYYNHQMARDLPGEYSCKPADPKDQVPPPPTMSSLQTKHMFQQKLQSLAIQRLNLEKHLREFSHMVGYQNYPKYQELVMKHREIVRMQQAVEHQSSLQSAAATAPVPSTIPPINLQFDQNGVLINSSLIPSYNHSVQTSMPGMPNPLSPGAKETTRSHPYDNKAMQAMEHALQQQHHQQPHSQPQLPPPAHQIQHAMMQPSPEQHHPHYIPQEYHHQPVHEHHPPHHPHPPPQPTIDEEVVNVEAQQHQKTSKDFADKPELDVRQFLATWAETEEDDGVNAGLQNVILTEDTPIVVLEYNENLNLTTANNLTAQAICVSAPAAAAEKEATVLSKDQISTANVSTGSSEQQQSVPATVNIIHCITSTGEVCEEVPTIHIVDTLENEAVVKKIEGALHSLNPTDIKSIEEIVNKNNVNNATTTTAKEVSLEFLTTVSSTQPATTMTASVVQTKMQPTQQQQKNADEANAVVLSPSMNTEQTPAAASGKKDETPEKTTASSENNLTNFVIDDTRNQDDLSLPDLPTSECTTTLNTPNQSDNEESSSERVRAMNISPIISFAHSPIKFQKSGDDLHFDFQSSNEAMVLKDANTSTTTTVQSSRVDMKTHNKGTTELKSQVLQAETENAVSTPSTQTQEQQVASVIDSFEFAEFSNSSTLPLGEEPKMPVPPMEGNCLTKIIKDTPPITNLRVLDSDDELTDKVNDIWMDINLDNALCNSVNKLIEEKQVQTKLKSSLRHVRKNKGVVSIVGKLIDEKSNDDKASDDSNPVRESKQKERITRRSLDSSMKNSGLERPRKRARSVEVDYNSSQDQEDLLKEFKNLKRKRSIGQLQDDIEMLKTSIDKLKNHNANNTVPITENNVCKNNSLPILPDTKVAHPPKRRFSSIFDPDTVLNKRTEDTSLKNNCVDSNIKIQLPNVNLQIQDKKETNSNAYNTSANEAIKIEINVSRVESQRNSNDNEIVSKSNQQLNISLPPANPMSYKVDCRKSITAFEDEITSCALPAKETIEEKSIVFVEEKSITKETEEDDNIITFENKNAEIEDSKCLIIENKENMLLKKKEIDIENAMKKLEEAKEDCFKNKTFVEAPGCSKDFDFDNFDVEPFDDKSDDYMKDLLGRKSNSNSVGYLNPLFHLNELENLNNVPVYTTKDGKITYSPNPNYTYRALIIESRQRESHALFREFHNKKNKHSRHKNKRERETISFENCLTNDQNNQSDNKERIEKVMRSTILDSTDNEKSGIRLSPVPSTPPSMVFESSRSMPLLDEETASNSKGSMTRCIVDLQNLKEDILKKLNDQTSSIFSVQTNLESNSDKEDDKCTADEILKANVEDNAVEKKDKSKLEQDNVDENVPDKNGNLRKYEIEIDETVDVDRVVRDNQESVKDDSNDKITVQEFIKDNIDKVEANVANNFESNTTIEKESSSRDIKQVEEFANSIEETDNVKSDNHGENKETPVKIPEKSVDEIDIVIVLEKTSLDFQTKLDKSKQDTASIEDSDDNTTKVIKSVEPEKEPQESVNANEEVQSESLESIKEQNPILEVTALIKPKITQEHVPAVEMTAKKPRTTPKTNMGSKSPKHTMEVESIKVKTLEHISTVERMPELTPIAKLIEKMPELTRIVNQSIKTPEHTSTIEFGQEENSFEIELVSKLKIVPNKEEIAVPPYSQKSTSPPKSSSLSLPCSIDKSSFSSELCDSFINQEKLHDSQGRIVPKLVIRKTDPKYFTKSKTIDTNNTSDDQKKDESMKSLIHPKIPKMIIRNAKSRPSTPSIEEISESSDSESKPLLMRLKREEHSEAKIPKMKIKLEEKQPRVVIENIASEVKTVPKMKITNVKSCQPKIIDTEDDSSDSDRRSRAKRSSSAASSQSKRTKRSPKEEVNLDPNHEDTQFPLENEYRRKNSNNSKVPKVIIKRTSPTAEFKCELSKDAIVNSQPKVVLNRSWVLDCMAKDLRHMKVVVKVSNNGKEEVKKEKKTTNPNELQWRRFISGLKKRRELSRSNSTPDLHQLSPKIKRRRTSDYCLDSNIEYSDSDSGTRFAFKKTKFNTEARKLPTTDVFDENMNSRSKMDLEEIPPRLETIMEASNSYSSEYVPTELLDRDVDVHEEEVDFECSVIKVDSSDESETTIEILPASPNLSFEKDVVDEEQIYSEDAVPMQVEYEVEIGEQTPDPVNLPLPSSEICTDKSSSGEVKQIPGIMITEQLVIEDTSGNTSIGEEIIPPISSDVEVVETCLSKSSESTHNPITPVTDDIETSLSKLSESPTPKAAENLLSKSSSNQVLLNEEASSTSTIMNNENANSRETEEEEDSGTTAIASCSSSDLLVKEVLAAKEMLKKYLGCLTSSSTKDTEIDKSTSFTTKNGRSVSHSSNFRHSEKRKKLNRIKSRNSSESRSLRTSSSNRHMSSNNRLPSKQHHRDNNEHKNSRSHQIKYKSTMKSCSQTNNVDPLTRAVEENLKHLKQHEKPEISVDETRAKRVDNVISRLDEANLKAKALQLSPEMTISSIVRELVFHDKATIRHRRYCMLCERWFPTTLRHRRHLAGYQHRHTELTQRRAIHMLFLIFTGKLCPKLLPPNIVRTDCVPGELTPLQIAVQDFATVFDGIQQVTEKQENGSKK